MPRKILIVDDSEINRKVLVKILSADYEWLEAEDGEQALAALFREPAAISAVLLDLAMPVLDGYAVLARMRQNEALAQIPVIVTTGNTEVGAEVKALSLGANDYIIKPYNAAVIKHRLRNTINLRETAAIANIVKKDALTGLPNRETFFARVKELVSRQAPGYYVMACFDIDHFKVVNEQYGTETGDRVLRAVADTFREGFEPVGGICSRIMADYFAAIYPRSMLDTPELQTLRDRAAAVDGLPQPLSFSIGRYVIDDVTLPPNTLYDRASIAAASVKGRFDAHIAEYNPEMHARIAREQEIVGEMSGALERGEFEIWFQPQYNHATGALIGAEALVRWRHPVRGLIPPGEFIPVFERSGFIYELDKFVWEQTCILLQRWQEQGRAFIPLSVNVSRYDMLRPDFFAVLTNFVESYCIPTEHLRLEVTESAFAVSTARMAEIVKRLVDYGFTVEIDDFGSGYSSLNILKDVPANVLKLDMRFLESTSNSQRGGSILESVVRMAKWLGMPVIAEGVETRAQADYLLSIGCNYVQGFLYAKPMPVSTFEAVAADSPMEREMLALETVDTLDNDAFWDPASMDTLIFNSYVGGACIYEYNGGKTELLRVNEKYAQMLGSSGMSMEAALELDLTDHMDADSLAMLRECTLRAIHNREEASCEICLFRLPGARRFTYLRMTNRVIAQTGARLLIYCSVTDITAQREAEQKERGVSAQMQAIMRNINGGVTAVTLEENKPHFLFANEQYFEQLGYTRTQFFEEVGSAFQLVHPEDRMTVMAEAERASLSRKSYTIVYRAIRRDGSIVWMQSNVSITSLPGVDEPVQLAVANDITAQRYAERKERSTAEQMQIILQNVNGGVSAATLTNGEISYLFVNDMYYTMFGYAAGQPTLVLPKKLSEFIHPDDLARVSAEMERSAAIGKQESMEYRARTRNGEWIWVRSTGATCKMEGVHRPVHITVYADITKEKEFEHRMRTAVEHLRVNEEEMRLAMAQMGRAVCVYDVTGRTLTFPEAYAEKHGYPTVMRDVLSRIACSHNLDDESKARFGQFFAAMLRGDARGATEMRIRCADGSWCDERYEFVTFLDENGAPAKAVISIEDTTAQHEAENETILLRESERLLRTVAAHSNRMIYRYDPATRTASRALADTGEKDTFVIDPEAPKAALRRGTVLPESLEDYRRVFREIAEGRPKGGAKLHLLNAEGAPRWLELQYTLLNTGGKKPASVVLSFLDITDAHEKELAYSRYLQTVDGRLSDSAMIYLEADLTQDVTEKRGGTVIPEGFPEAGACRGEIIDFIADTFIVPGEREKCREFFSREHLITKFADGVRNCGEDWSIRFPDGEPGFIHSDLQLVEDPYSGHIKLYTLLRDITREKRAAMAVRQMAEMDGMTGLYNKVTAERLIRERLSESDARGCALLIADLDNLKLINDHHGHDVGDRAIRLFADALRTQFRHSDIVGRVGGDEFVAFLDGGGNDARVRSTIAMLLWKLSSIHIDTESDATLHGSIGVAIGVVGTDSYEALFKKADRALYHVKRNGKDDYAFYTPEMELPRYAHRPHDSTSIWQADAFDREEQERLLHAVSAIYPLVISVNLTKDSYFIVQNNSFTTSVKRAAGAYSALIAEGAESCHPGDREAYNHTLSRMELLAAYEHGQTAVVHRARQLGDDGVYRLIRTDVIFSRDEDSGDVLGTSLMRQSFAHIDWGTADSVDSN